MFQFWISELINLCPNSSPRARAKPQFGLDANPPGLFLETAFAQDQNFITTARAIDHDSPLFEGKAHA